MYTEVKELVNFLAIYMHYRIPRRRICLFLESYSNHLLARFSANWNPEEPNYGEKERILSIKTHDGMDQVFTHIATSMGILMEELELCFPTPMYVYCNPGEVSGEVTDQAHHITVWIGDVNADNYYTLMPTGIALYYEVPMPMHRDVINNRCLYSPKESRPNANIKKEIRSQRCILFDLVSSADLIAYDLLTGGFFPGNQIPPYLFHFTAKDCQSFTVRSFALTRFGSHRLRPDHATMRRIQQAAASLAIDEDGNYHYVPGCCPQNIQFAFGPGGDYGDNEQPHDNYGLGYHGLGMAPAIPPALASAFPPAMASVFPPAIASAFPPAMPAALPPPIVSAAPTASVASEKTNYSTMAPMTTTYANAAAKAVAGANPNHSNPSFYSMAPPLMLQNPINGSINNIPPFGGQAFLPPLPAAAEAASDFAHWNYAAGAGDTKPNPGGTGFMAFDGQKQFDFTYPYNPPKPANNNLNTFPYVVGREMSQNPPMSGPNLSPLSFPFYVNPGQFLDFPPIPSPWPFPDFTTVAPPPSPMHQVYNFDPNPDIAEMQSNLNRMSFAEMPPSAPSTSNNNNNNINNNSAK